MSDIPPDRTLGLLARAIRSQLKEGYGSVQLSFRHPRRPHVEPHWEIRALGQNCPVEYLEIAPTLGELLAKIK